MELQPHGDACGDKIRLYAIAVGHRYEASNILDTTEFIVPEFTLHSHGYDRHLPPWNTELQIDLRFLDRVRTVSK